jgi:hypothetical protein
MARKQTGEIQLTTAQRLGSVVKSARDIMRKDKGLNGDLDRLPMLTWIMFLKFLDDAEEVREAEAKLEGKRFRPAVEPPYRWRDWAAKEDGITGDERSSTTTKRYDPTANAAWGCSPTCGRSRVPTGETDATSSPLCTRARSTGCSPGTCCGTF